MATAKMHFQPQRRGAAGRVLGWIIRLLQTQRAEEVFPVLLEEIVALGYPRAAILELEAPGGMTLVAALNWQQEQIVNLTTPSLTGLREGRPAVLTKTDSHNRPLYVHPISYSSPNPCWEAGHTVADNCLAVQNFARQAISRGESQICSLCEMRGYSALAIVELRRHNPEGDLAILAELIQVANLYFSRLLKAEHYYNRLRDKEIAIAQTSAAMQRMNQPAALSGVQRRALLEDKAGFERRMLEIEKFAAAGRLAATIAHEVNNPMEAIKNAVYLLGDSVAESAMPVYNILQSETERVARVVRQMLGLYRDTEPVKPVNVNVIIEDTLLLLKRQLQRANVRVEAELGVLPEALIAADQIRQVLSNMILNARDAMPSGGKLWIRSRHIPARDNVPARVRISIADTGTGIPPQIIDDIFEPFVTTKGDKGTGLGLWIVQGIIQTHAGSLKVKSRVGKGTVFRIDLPLAKL
jgi:signal transduction histidine kinase